MLGLKGFKAGLKGPKLDLTCSKSDFKGPKPDLMDLGGFQTRIWCFRGFGDLKPGFGSLKAFLKAANQALGPQVRPRAIQARPYGP